MSKHGSQRAIREPEASKLVIKGVGAGGKEFEEQTETIDISETGISFFLQTPIWMDSHLTIQIRSSSLFGSESVQKAKVVRLRSEPSGRQFVGARFDD
jgi:hypothetical protein